MAQALAYEVCDRTHTPLYTTKTLEMCKRKHVLFDSKSFKVCGRSHVQRNVFYLSVSINVLTIIFEIKKKENNAAVLTLLTDANLKILLY